MCNYNLGLILLKIGIYGGWKIWFQKLRELRTETECHILNYLFYFEIYNEEMKKSRYLKWNIKFAVDISDVNKTVIKSIISNRKQ